MAKLCLTGAMGVLACMVALPATAPSSHLRPYDETVRCATKTVRDVQVVERSRRAVVFRKLKDTARGALPVSYACAHRRSELRQSVYRLDDPVRSRRAEGARLAGEFVAYRLADRSDPSVASSELVVQSLSHSTRLSFFPKPEETDTASDVVAFVVKPTGAVAWMAIGHPSGEQGVWKANRNWLDDEIPRLDGSPPAIDVRSLRLSQDRRRVEWRRRGESRVRSAPLG
jgi:hypothetical protein